MVGPVAKGFTYYWSSMSNGHHVKGIAIGISSRLQPSIVEVTPDDGHIMRLRLMHTLGFMSVVAVYAPTEVCETEEEEMFYAELDSVLDQCPYHNERAGYEICLGSHGSGTRNDNNSFLLSLARSRRLRIVGSWYQRPALHRWTWYSNARGVAKEIDHLLKDTPELQGFPESRFLCN